LNNTDMWDRGWEETNWSLLVHSCAEWQCWFILAVEGFSSRLWASHSCLWQDFLII